MNEWEKIVWAMRRLLDSQVPAVLFKQDAETVLKMLPAECLDAILTDPPYGTASGTKLVKRGNHYEAFNLEWDRDLPLDWLELAARAMKPGASIIAFTNTSSITVVREVMKAVGLKVMCDCFWLVTNPPPQARKTFCSAVQAAVFARKPGKLLHWGGGGTSMNYFLTTPDTPAEGVALSWEGPLVSGEERLGHPTQKPVSLMQHLASLICPPGGIIMDPFMGSGTTGEAALNLGMRFLGCDNDMEPGAFQMAQTRLEEVGRRVTQNLFQAPVARQQLDLGW